MEAFKRSVTPYLARESWLAAAMTELRKHFAESGYTIPDAVRVACGLPSTGAFGLTKRTRGEAWCSTATRDRHYEIFVSPTVDNPRTVLAVLTHELVHVTVGLAAGHRGKFIECGRAIGLMGPWTTATADETLSALHKQIAKQLGKYPHGSLDRMTNAKKKQTARLIKVGCPHCGYTTRIAMSWILLAVPVCPNELCDHQGETFEVVMPDE